MASSPASGLLADSLISQRPPLGSLVPSPGLGLLLTVHVTACWIWLIVVSPLEGEGPVGSLAQDRCWELLLPLGDLDGFHPAWTGLAFNLDGGPLSASCCLSGPPRPGGGSGGLLVTSSRGRPRSVCPLRVTAGSSAGPAQRLSWPCSLDSAFLEQDAFFLWARNC